MHREQEAVSEDHLNDARTQLFIDLIVTFLF